MSKEKGKLVVYPLLSFLDISKQQLPLLPLLLDRKLMLLSVDLVTWRDNVLKLLRLKHQKHLLTSFVRRAEKLAELDQPEIREEFVEEEK